MAFTEAQLKSLEAKLDSKHVKTRQVQDTILNYVEGWHVIAEANRIFGYDAWDRQTITTHCVWSGMAKKLEVSRQARRMSLRSKLLKPMQRRKPELKKT